MLSGVKLFLHYSYLTYIYCLKIALADTVAVRINDFLISSKVLGHFGTYQKVINNHQNRKMITEIQTCITIRLGQYMKF